MTLAHDELLRAAPGRDCAVTVGVFDGVHRGHLHLIGELREQAQEKGLAAGIVTLHPAPMVVLKPGSVMTYLTSLEERIELLRASGVDFVAPLTFTSEVAQLSARRFAELMVEALGLKLVIMGPDHAFGRGREGTPAYMSQVGREMSFQVELFSEPLTNGGQVVSSTAVRAALEGGDMEKVAALLGRCFSVRGPVVEGARRGKSIGFPTANVGLAPDRALPPFGVYVTRAYLGEADYRSVTNIGRRPTFEPSGFAAPTVEVYLMDYDSDDFYGRELRVEFVLRLRDEKRFSGVDELAAQIKRDVAAADVLLGRE